jgi:light-regulated signal transduction histidine kinase (bacteriophytochrome)
MGKWSRQNKVLFGHALIVTILQAGNPYEKFIKEGTEGYLEPRKSFKTWSETVIGKCRDWTEEQVETAAVLCLVYGKFIEVRTVPFSTKTL